MSCMGRKEDFLFWCRSPDRPRWDRIDSDIIALFETSLRKVFEMHPVPMNVSMVRSSPTSYVRHLLYAPHPMNVSMVRSSPTSYVHHLLDAD